MKVYKNFNLKEYNSYRIESICSEAYFPENEEDIITLFTIIRFEKFHIIGNGNNIILSKEYYSEPFVILNGVFNKIELEGDLVSAYSGATTKSFSEFALENNFTNAEFYYDIPSSIGGAIVMNAGTKEGETKDILVKVRYLDLEDMQIKEKESSEIELTYRNSFFQKSKNKIILKGWFRLNKGHYNEIYSLMHESKDRRWSKQPRNYPNCGSVFKRPPGRFVGPMLDELGLKGYTIGGAQVSRKHSGFIINVGNATGSDILNLISYIKEKVYSAYQVELVVEQRII